jgi:single-stranded-DNA-specific exonuclease
MLTTIDGVAKGSARSVSNFDIYDALQQCEDYLIQFGGHRAAAGLAIELEKLSDFKIKFNEIVRTSLNDDELLPEIAIDSPLRFSEITPKLLRILDQFSPFGPGNMRPVFLSENVMVYNTPRKIGNNQNHVLCSFKQEGCDKIFDCIGFNMSDYYDILINSNGDLNIVYTIDEVIRNDKSFPQFRLKDIKTKVMLEEKL